ncbi:SUMF1/EgtB/PvdO family nonheme iron enzyme [Nostoc sp. UIC 10607]|uniref:SUMF1/EgtB/PvdO family nonheme iron enzyme n=1 Tax=Nostoc sp. UIC 10607 TaxID=3045935 RepID=UPI00399F7894
MSEPPLLNLFLGLREAGLPLGIDQYYLAEEALLQSIEAGLDIADKQAVARLCQTVWVKSRQQQRLFNQCWNEILSYPARFSKSPIIDSPNSKKSARSKPSSSDKSKPLNTIEENQNQPEEEKQEVSLTPASSDAAVVVTSVSTKLKEGDYFPVRRQQLRRGWRLLMQKLPGSIPSQIDIRETVTDVAKRGFFLKPVLTAPQIQYREVVLLIDQKGSMVPFHPFCRQLVEIWQGAKIYYFRNSPTEELYHDSQCWQGESIKSILRRFSQKKTLVVIVSDAGAARRRTVPSRWEETVDFLAMLTPRVNKVAWLNPLPRFHWRNTTAKFIAEVNSLVPMFALESAEYQQMLQWLFDGKPSIKSFLKQAEKKAIEKEPFGSFNIWEIEEYNAKGQIEAFGIMFREAHLNFAYHAAFPLVLTPDLLYCLWWKFFKESEFKESETPWYVVANLLLSDLCREVDTELYEMEREVRNELLRLCQEKFGEQRLQELSQFLIEYINRQFKKHQPNSLSFDLLQVQQWTALAYIKKGDEAAKELAEKLRQAYLQSNKAELVRLSEVIETLAEPLREKYEPLLLVARGYGALARGDEKGRVDAQDELDKLGFRETVNVQGVVLERPITLDKIFSFEVVTVNRRGKIIKQVTKQARYFIEDLGDNINLEMVAIPGGKFMMGSPDGEGDNDEHPQHDVTVQPFFMGKYLVTQAQWRVVAKLPNIERNLKEDPSNFKGDDLPVDSVSWYDAEEFCKRLSQKTGRQYRLPSEAEWEYACRADTTTPFHLGETITGKLANYDASNIFADEPKGEYREKTTSVKTFTPNAFGLFDMHGNLWEWCADVWHENYEGAPIDGSAWMVKIDNDNQLRVLRGGSWNNYPEGCRSANRSRLYPDVGLDDNGFRVVCGAAARIL